VVLAAAVAVAPSLAQGAPPKVDAKLRGTRAPATELKQSKVIAVPGGGTIYRFRQQVSGVPVLGGEAVVSDPAAAPPGLVVDVTKARIQKPPAPRIPEGRAIATASRAVGVTRTRAPSSARLAIDSADDGAFVWRVEIPSAHPLGDFEVLVDAVSGDILGTQDLLHDFRTGKAKLFDPNPVVENGGFAGLRSDHNDKDFHLLTALRRSVALPKIKGGQNCLRGEWANAKLGHGAHAVCKRSLRWKGVTRSSDKFEALMTYYEITRAQQYIHDLGFSRANHNPIDDRSQLAVADACMEGSCNVDNSFYSPFSRRIKYGPGGVDDAEDADVIWHEYGHAMQDSESHSFSTSQDPATGALAEGSSDYWAAAMSSRSPGTANEDDVCIFDWDATSYGDKFPAVPPFSVGRFCGRRADLPWTVAKAEDPTKGCHSDIHCVGQVWSSALWDLRNEIGGKKMDTIYLTAQFMYHAHEDFDQAAAALVDADATLYGGSHQATICSEMQDDRGLTVAGCP
jgi:Zn-dependent metalloprotease